METDNKEIIDSIYKEYKTRLLSTEQAAKILNKSTTTLGRWRKEGIYLEYKKNGAAKNTPVFYMIETIVEYILNNNIKVS